MNNRSEKYLNSKIRLLLILLLTLCVFGIYILNPDRTYGVLDKDDIKLNSKSAIAIDVETGNVLFEKDASKKIYPASTLKILTALVALEEGDLKDEITVSKNALEGQKNGGTNIGLKEDEKIVLEDALYGMLLESANDAAIAIGEHYGNGSMKDFAKLMNKKAKKLGLDNSHFVNSYGFFDEDQYTTVEDLAKLTRKAIKNEKLLEILSSPTYTLEKTNKRNTPLKINSTHKMFPGKEFSFESFVGGKTGFIEEAGNNLISLFKKDNRMILLVLSGPELKKPIYEDTKALFELIDKEYEVTSLSKDGSDKSFSDLIVDEDYPFEKLSKGMDEKIDVFMPVNATKSKIEFSIDNKLTLPVAKGDIIGYQVVKYKDDIIAKNPIVANEDYTKLSHIMHILFILLKYLLILIVIAVLALLGYREYLKRKRRKAKGMYRKKLKPKKYKPMKKEKRLFK